VTSFTLAALLQVSLLTTGDHSYAQAHKLQEETGRPLVVLIGADWCPACQTMKNSVIPQAQAQGVLSNVAFAEVNTDQEPKLSKQLMRGGMIPQLIVYHKTSDGWQRKELVGAQSIGAIQGLIKQIQPAPAAATPRVGR
jgi:thioredoxin-like negative regulator of GroEL